MAKGYDKEFLVDAFISRYASLPDDKLDALVKMANSHYDLVGKDKFRLDASLDAEAVRNFKLVLASK
jgi:hypothetical protein